MKKKGTDPLTDDLELGTVPENGLTQTYEAASRGEKARGAYPAAFEANIILIAHPESKRLGMRLRMTPGAVLEVGRAPDLDISLPEVPSISRKHARLHHKGPSVTLEDLGSTNGTYVNGKLIPGRTTLRSGDRFQVAAVHFKFLHERDVEHAYYEAIYDLVTRDGLTDIYNKRKYDEEISREFSRSFRHRRPLALIAIDLDSFKQINDQYGHLCGDVVLKEFTSLVRERLRPEEVFARVGGDEFVVLMPETGIEGAQVLAEKIRDSLAHHEVRYGDVSVQVTCSCGVAELAGDMDTPEDLYVAADRALYASKHAGRNRVSFHSTSARRFSEPQS